MLEMSSEYIYTRYCLFEVIAVVYVNTKRFSLLKTPLVELQTVATNLKARNRLFLMLGRTLLRNMQIYPVGNTISANKHVTASFSLSLSPLSLFLSVHYLACKCISKN